MKKYLGVDEWDYEDDEEFRNALENGFDLIATQTEFIRQLKEGH